MAYTPHLYDFISSFFPEMKQCIHNIFYFGFYVLLWTFDKIVKMKWQFELLLHDAFGRNSFQKIDGIK